MTTTCSKSSRSRLLEGIAAKSFYGRQAEPCKESTAVNSQRSDLTHHCVLSTAEAAAFLNFSIPHFRRLYRSGDVPAPIHLSTRKLGWRMGDLIDWIATRQTRPTTD